MAIEEKQAYSQIELTEKRSSRQTDDDELCSLVPPTTFKSLGSTCSTDAVIIMDDDDKKETLELKKKKPKFVSRWDDVDGINELIGDPRFSSITNLHEDDERSLSSTHHNNFIDLCDNVSYRDGNNKENQDPVGYVSLEGFGVPVENPRLGDFYVDLSEDEILGGNKGNRHVSLDELGVSVEDLKRMPWEAFDPTWEIRSETMDP